MKALCLATALLVAVSVRVDAVPSQPEPNKLKTAALYASVPVVDLALTEYGLVRHPHMQEGNPLFRSRPARLLGTAATVAVLTHLDLKLQRSGRRRTTKILRIGFLSARVLAVGWNANKLLRER